MANQTLNQQVPYALLERLGWPLELINDYTQLRNDLTPAKGTATDPNGTVRANSNGLYVKINAPTALWFNPNPGEVTGWVQIA